MKDKPVSGWRTDVIDLGLPSAPPGAPDGSKIPTSRDPSRPRPIVGTLGDRAYFLATSPGAVDDQWWLVGIDATDGHRLFPAVPLDSAPSPPTCLLNGTDAVLCLRDEVIDGVMKGSVAWTVNIRTGAVDFNGPTDLHALPGELTVKQAGFYVVATTPGQGVYGVGSRAETTWFVPGDGSVQARPTNSTTPEQRTLASQGQADPNEYSRTVFALDDGAVLTPDLAAGSQLEKVMFFSSGGFAAEVNPGEGDAGVQFFDDTGKRVTNREVRGPLDAVGVDVPLVRNEDGWAAYAPDGGVVFDASGDIPFGVAIIGSRLLANTSESSAFPQWQSYDLRTKEKGKVCDFNMSNYLGTDGSVAVFGVTNPKVDQIAKGRDLNTCDTLWTLPSAPNSLARVWRIGTTLVQLSDDGTELMSLVAPN